MKFVADEERMGVSWVYKLSTSEFSLQKSVFTIEFGDCFKNRIKVDECQCNDCMHKLLVRSLLIEGE